MQRLVWPTSNSISNLVNPPNVGSSMGIAGGSRGAPVITTSCGEAASRAAMSPSGPSVQPRVSITEQRCHAVIVCCNAALVLNADKAESRNITRPAAWRHINQTCTNSVKPVPSTRGSISSVYLSCSDMCTIFAIGKRLDIITDSMQIETRDYDITTDIHTLTRDRCAPILPLPPRRDCDVHPYCRVHALEILRWTLFETPRKYVRRHRILLVPTRRHSYPPRFYASLLTGCTCTYCVGIAISINR